MKTILQILILICILTQCTQPLEPEAVISPWEKVKQSKSTKEFQLFIQNNASSDHFWEAVDRFCFLRDSLHEVEGCNLNYADVDTNGSDVFLFKGDTCSSKRLTQLAYEFLKNNRPNGSRQYEKPLVGLDTVVMVSGGFFVFAFYDRVEVKQSLQNAVMAVSQGMEQYKEHLSEEIYKRNLGELNESERIQIEELIGVRLWFYDWDGKERLILPPEPRPDLLDL